MNIVLPRFAKNICHWPEKPRRDIAAASTGEDSSLIRSIIAIIVFITKKKKSAADDIDDNKSGRGYPRRWGLLLN